MVDHPVSPQWLCAGKSVRGSAHERSGLPNQDAIAWYSESKTGTPLILAVSDGHGSAKSFRSEFGSHFAVTTAIEVIREFLLTDSSGDINTSNIKNMEDMVKRLLPIKLTERWKDTVSQHLQECEFNDGEKNTLLGKEGKKGVSSIKANPSLAYGATLLLVVITDSFILYLQLGDGDILCVDEGGEVTKPLAKNPDLIGNETTSLCMPNAWNLFQIELVSQHSPRQVPALILLSTDGYANSYASDEEFFKIGRDYLTEIKRSGIESIEEQLAEFLSKISSGGSGDDITLGIVSRIERDNSDESDRQATIENGGDSMQLDDKNSTTSIEILDPPKSCFGK
jgi:serine/threonine protein phosphatase PrpC